MDREGSDHRKRSRAQLCCGEFPCFNTWGLLVSVLAIIALVLVSIFITKPANDDTRQASDSTLEHQQWQDYYTWRWEVCPKEKVCSRSFDCHLSGHAKSPFNRLRTFLPLPAKKLRRPQHRCHPSLALSIPGFSLEWQRNFEEIRQWLSYSRNVHGFVVTTLLSERLRC